MSPFLVLCPNHQLRTSYCQSFLNYLMDGAYLGPILEVTSVHLHGFFY